MNKKNLYSAVSCAVFLSAIGFACSASRTATVKNHPRTEAEISAVERDADLPQARPTDRNGAVSPPTQYSQFTLVRTADELVKAVNNMRISCIALAPGSYVLNEPLTINRPGGSLYIHGFNRFATLIRSKGTVLRIQAAQTVQLAGLTICKNGTGAETGINFEQKQPINFSAMDMVMRDATLNITAPGQYRLQGMKIYSGTNSETALIVNHPQADVTGVHLDFMTETNNRRDDKNICHAHQKKGRLRMFALQAEVAAGRYEFVFEGANSYGPNVIAGMRTEGDNLADKRCGESVLRAFVGIFGVGTSVVIKANGINNYATPACRKNSAMVEMNSTGGKLWLLGNNSRYRCGRLVTGTDRSAQIVALGNMISNTGDADDLIMTDKEVFPILASSAIKIVEQGNQYHINNPKARVGNRYLSNKNTELLTQEKINTVIPSDDIPESLQLPNLDTDFDGLFVNVKKEGAKGDGKTDDTKAIQAALTASISKDSKGEYARNALVYFPAGNYRITQTLKWIHPRALGGFMGGADSGSVKIINTNNNSILSMAAWGATVQGITFMLPKPATSACTKGLLSISSYNNGGGNACSSIQIFLKKCAFRNGEIGVAIGNMVGETDGNAIWKGISDEMTLIDHCVLANNQIGLTVGHFNALQETVSNCLFTDNRYNIRNFCSTNPYKRGSQNTYFGAGTWNVLNSRFTRTSGFDFQPVNAVSPTFYYNNITTDAQASLCPYGGLDPQISFFENSRFLARQGVGKNTIELATSGQNCLKIEQNGFDTPGTDACNCFDKGGGIFFLNSDLSTTKVAFTKNLDIFVSLILVNSKAPFSVVGGSTFEYTNTPTLQRKTVGATVPITPTPKLPVIPKPVPKKPRK